MGFHDCLLIDVIFKDEVLSQNTQHVMRVKIVLLIMENVMILAGAIENQFIDSSNKVLNNKGFFSLIHETNSQKDENVCLTRGVLVAEFISNKKKEVEGKGRKRK